jgi:hypothetical protein
MQVRFDESSAQFNRPLESRNRIFRRVARGASMGDDPWNSHWFVILADSSLDALEAFARVVKIATQLLGWTRP